MSHATTLDEVLALRSENTRLRNTLALHAGDTMSLEGEVRAFKAQAEAAEAENQELWLALAEAAELAADLTEPNMQQSVMHLYARAVELRSKISSLKTR